MRGSSRNRCRPAVAALCIAVVLSLLVSPAMALMAEYMVEPDGSAYRVKIMIEDRDTYYFRELGMLGEQVPFKAEDVLLDGTNASYTWVSDSQITFPDGDYVLEYTAPLKDRHFLAVFDEPYDVRLSLPEVFNVKNPALGMISGGGSVVAEDGGTVIAWDSTPVAECRFYDRDQELMLYTFGMFWVLALLVLLVPYLISRRRGRK